MRRIRILHVWKFSGSEGHFVLRFSITAALANVTMVLIESRCTYLGVRIDSTPSHKRVEDYDRPSIQWAFTFLRLWS